MLLLGQSGHDSGHFRSFLVHFYKLKLRMFQICVSDMKCNMKSNCQINQLEGAISTGEGDKDDKKKLTSVFE